MRDYKNSWLLRLQKMYPELWLFLEGEESYKNDAKDDLNCRRWKHILEIAYFVSIRDVCEVICKPNEITFKASKEYRDHHGDEGVEFCLNRAKKITKEEYMTLKEHSSDISEAYKKSLSFKFSNIFYLKADIFDDYTLIKPIKPSGIYSDQLAVLGRIKDMEGYFLFEFNS